MASPPPPYSSVTGIFSSVTKHHTVTLAQYNGVARPGQLVVDSSDYTQLYIGDNLGNLNVIGGGGSGNGYVTLLVTNSTYNAIRGDYYIGVNRPGPVSIVLPPDSINGDMIVIKDESNACSINPITLVGTIDGDIGGAVLEIDGGAVHMIYRNGWRII